MFFLVVFILFWIFISFRHSYFIYFVLLSCPSYFRHRHLSPLFSILVYSFHSFLLKCTFLRQLSKEMPLPLLDKHYRGARYSVDDPIGVLVPEELSLRRETLHGPIRLPWQEQLKNVFLPNYHYQQWASRPMHEVSFFFFFCFLILF